MLPERNLGTAPSYRRTVAVVAAVLAIGVLVSKPLIANAAELPVDLGYGRQLRSACRPRGYQHAHRLRRHQR